MGPYSEKFADGLFLDMWEGVVLARREFGLLVHRRCLFGSVLLPYRWGSLLCLAFAVVFHCLNKVIFEKIIF